MSDMENTFDEREDSLDLINTLYAFPCFIPVTVIMQGGDSSRKTLEEALRYTQDGAPFEIESARESGKGKYVSYKISLMISSAEALIERRDFLRNLEGVFLVL
jgi:putative lipoic acid-binding regulatory protein